MVLVVIVFGAVVLAQAAMVTDGARGKTRPEALQREARLSGGKTRWALKAGLERDRHRSMDRVSTTSPPGLIDRPFGSTVGKALQEPFSSTLIPS
ncbi:hypothetical protein SKAU_G00308140 [Synaphobranchus kaupii]|uniref:Secreted protein n=1 Tax=Synaphobranchus kaupii TaxID=118154 RepID=A0A9Q1ER74_SYNKA|nr:hypothetical protein SKAU_G00308140 [Synaphobranchus kaupii]